MFPDSAFSMSKIFPKNAVLCGIKKFGNATFPKSVSFSVSVTFFKIVDTQCLYWYFAKNIILGDVAGPVLTGYLGLARYCCMKNNQNISVTFHDEVSWQSQGLWDGEVSSSHRDRGW